MAATNLSISHLNIKGLHDPNLGCKLNNKNLLQTISKYDIYVLSETWGCNHDINVPGFDKLVLRPNKRKNTSGRSSGGIILFYKKHLSEKVQFLKQTKNSIWIKINSCIENHSGNQKDTYLCATYIPPKNSPYYSIEIFDEIQRDMVNYSKSSLELSD